MEETVSEKQKIGNQSGIADKSKNNKLVSGLKIFGLVILTLINIAGLFMAFGVYGDKYFIVTQVTTIFFSRCLFSISL